MWLMPLTVFEVKGIPGHRREPIEAAVVAGGKHLSATYEAWIAADPFKNNFRLLITTTPSPSVSRWARLSAKRGQGGGRGVGD